MTVKRIECVPGWMQIGQPCRSWCLVSSVSYIFLWCFKATFLLYSLSMMLHQITVVYVAYILVQAPWERVLWFQPFWLYRLQDHSCEFVSS